MKIGVLTKRYYTGKDLLKDRYGRLYHLPKAWAGLGAEVEVIALDYRTNREEEIKNGRMRVRSLPSAKLWSRELSGAVNWLDFNLVVTSGHLNIAHMGLLQAKACSLPCVLDVYDYYPAFIGRLHPIFRCYMHYLLSRSDGVMTVSRSLYDFCRKHSESVERVPNGVDRQMFCPVEKSMARERCDLAARQKYIGLFGSVNRDLGMEDVLKALEIVRAHDPTVSLLVAGQGSERMSEFEGVYHLGLRTQSEVALWASACDCLLIPYRQSLQVKYSQSARLAEYLSLERPVVVTRTGDAEAWFGPDYSGWCDPASPHSMAEAIMRQLKCCEVNRFPSELEWQSLGRRSYLYLQSVVEGRYKSRCFK